MQVFDQTVHGSNFDSLKVVGTSENVMYFWGTRFFKDQTYFNSASMCPTPQLPTNRSNMTKDLLNTSFGTRLATPLDKPLSDSEVHSMLQVKHNSFITKDNLICDLKVFLYFF